MADIEVTADEVPDLIQEEEENEEFEYEDYSELEETEVEETTEAEEGYNDDEDQPYRVLASGSENLAKLEKLFQDEVIKIDSPANVIESRPTNTYTFGYQFEMGADGLPKVPDVILTKDMIRNGLSKIGRTIDTFQFAYVKLEARGKRLTNIDVLTNYIYLRVVDLSENRITSLHPLASMKHLLVLSAHTNQIKSLQDVPYFEFLQALSLMSNRLTSTKGLYQNTILYLQLSFNTLETLDEFISENYPLLQTLEVRGNQLRSLKGIDLPRLQRIYLAQNRLTNLDGIEGCPELQMLHARENNISRLENFPALPKLEYVNLRDNKLARFTQTANLGKSCNIKTLLMMENPIAESERYKSEMIAANISLKRLDKEVLTEMETVEGRSLHSARANGISEPLEDDPNILDAQDNEELEEEGENFSSDLDGNKPVVEKNAMEKVDTSSSEKPGTKKNRKESSEDKTPKGVEINA